MKQQPRYTNTHNKGEYVIAYQCPAGAGKPGIPKDDMTDLMTMKKVGGSKFAPDWLFISEFEFKSNFRESTLLTDPAPKAEPGSRYGDIQDTLP